MNRPQDIPIPTIRATGRATGRSKATVHRPTRAASPALPTVEQAVTRMPVIELPETPPLVSCIMPTANRAGPARLAVDYFLRQTYPNRELIVVDDGCSAIDARLPIDPHIRYIRLQTRHTVGHKRNIACEAARGAIILHWDDDDWMADWRMAYQVERLLAEEADVCGLSRLFYYAPRTRRTWLYQYPDQRKPWVSGNTLCYRREFWEQNRFSDVDVGEDARFLWSADNARVVALPEISFYVAMIHQENVSPKLTNGRRWQAIPPQRVLQLLGEDHGRHVQTLESLSRARTRFLGARPATSLERRAASRPGRLKRGGELSIVDTEASTLLTSSEERSSSPNQGTLPLVSCIMPTRDRRAFVSKSLEYFRRQTYPNLELIVVDDGDDPVADLMPDDPRVSYVLLDNGRSIGYKRNVAVQHARGEFIAHWDDDDWYGPDRVARQVGPLLDSVADITGFHEVPFFDLEEGTFWRCNPATFAAMFVKGVHGGSIAYRKSLWGTAAVFPDISLAEDARFLARAARCGILKRLSSDGSMVYVRHETAAWNFTCGEAISRSGWTRLEAPGFIPEEDREFFSRFRNAATTSPTVGETKGVARNVHPEGKVSQAGLQDAPRAPKPSELPDVTALPLVFRPQRPTSVVHPAARRIHPPRIQQTGSDLLDSSDRSAGSGTRRSKIDIRNRSRREAARRRLRRQLGGKGGSHRCRGRTLRLEAPPGERLRQIFDARNTRDPGDAPVRAEGDAPTGDPTVDEAYDHMGIVFDFFHEVFGRDSIDGTGLSLNCIVRYGRGPHNAYWNGNELLHCDGGGGPPGTGRRFNRFTASLGAIAHELTHGLVEGEANLVYMGQQGALNESFCDVMASLVKQWHYGQTADRADWEVGCKILGASVQGTAVRSLKAPGTAFNDPVLGRDLQVGHMRDYRKMAIRCDAGGVHLNSGIPNRAFYLTACGLGGYAWERAGRIWYEALLRCLRRSSDFLGAARATIEVAGELYGHGSPEQRAVRSGWKAVGVQTQRV